LGGANAPARPPARNVGQVLQEDFELGTSVQHYIGAYMVGGFGNWE